MGLLAKLSLWSFRVIKACFAICSVRLSMLSSWAIHFACESVMSAVWVLAFLKMVVMLSLRSLSCCVLTSLQKFDVLSVWMKAFVDFLILLMSSLSLFWNYALSIFVYRSFKGFLGHQIHQASRRILKRFPVQVMAYVDKNGS